MITCDLCGEAKDCSQKEIESKEYDICSECWKPLKQKLRGKGRARKEMVLLPPPRERTEREDDDKPVPGEPPKIWGAIDQPN
jgi:ribosome-binding protein aMBF1 (putative translation factor)